MDEFQIQVLEANGYSYIDGAIVDAEGNYVSSVEIGEGIIESESDKELWEEAKVLEEKYPVQRDSFGNLKAIENDQILENIILYKNNEVTEDIRTNTKETLKTTKTLTVKNDVKSSFKTEYKYPIVLITSLIIYLIIKKLIKQ